MEIKSIMDKTGNFIKKYKYIILIIAIGLALLIFPSQSTKRNNEAEIVQPQEQQQDDLESALSALLSKISGAGKVEVLLTLQEGEEQLFQTNENHSKSQDAADQQRDTVVITDSEHNQTGLVRKILAPTYRGAVVICEGADDPSVRLAIVDAIAGVTGLSTNRISVLKMK